MIMSFIHQTSLSRIFIQIRKLSRQNTNDKWQSVVGLEVHAQISTNSKLFSGSSTKFASAVNNSVSLFDCAIPGTLPVLNKKCVEAGVLTALALHCKVNPVSMFDRKHYFYADIPAGYQITQQRAPLAERGSIQFYVFTPDSKKSYTACANLKQIQLEQDSGRSLHDKTRSLVDLNRSGIPLMELVFEPDLKDGEEAASLVKELINILQRLGTCSCKMEEGALRVDANISVCRPGEAFGTRTEIKNIGSVRGIAGAVRFEIDRQIKLLEGGGFVNNETRTWHAPSKTTIPMRDKEEKQDYRYMPEPNLPPLHLAVGPVEHGCINVETLRQNIPELPEQTRNRLKNDHGLTLEQIHILVNFNKLLTLFTEAAKHDNIYSKLLANILINDLLTIVNKENIELDEVDTKGHHLKELIDLLQLGKINRNTTKLLLKETIKGNVDSLELIVEERGWLQISCEDELRKICEVVLQENPKIVKQYKAGKQKTFKAFLGIVYAKSDQRADMSKVTTILKSLLDVKK